MKRLPYLVLGLLLLGVNLVVPVLLHEMYLSGIIDLNSRNDLVLGDLVGVPVGMAAIYLVYKRSKDAGKVSPLFWIWLFASMISVSCYYISLSISNPLNAYFYYGADLICLGIGGYLAFLPSAPERVLVTSLP